VFPLQNLLRVLLVLHVERWDRELKIDERVRGLPVLGIEFVWMSSRDEDISRELWVGGTHCRQNVGVARDDSVKIIWSGDRGFDEKCDDSSIDLLLRDRSGDTAIRTVRER
jgi:hypothetical protein